MKRAGLGLLGLIAACGHAPPRSVFPNADAAIERMRASYACVNGVQGTAKIDHSSPKGRVRGEVQVLAENPDHVRFDVLAPVGLALLYTLTSDGKEFQMLDTTRKEFLFGPASACNIARLTQVPVPGHALVSMLRGEAPVLKHTPESASIDWDTDKGQYRIRITSTQEASQEIWLEVPGDVFDKEWKEQRVRVRGVKVVQKGYVLYDADLSSHERKKTSPPWVDKDGLEDPIPPSGPACEAELPTSLRMRVPATAEDVIFQYKDGKWNPPRTSPKAFHLDPVPGTIPVPVDCKD